MRNERYLEFMKNGYEYLNYLKQNWFPEDEAFLKEILFIEKKWLIKQWIKPYVIDSRAGTLP